MFNDLSLAEHPAFLLRHLHFDVRSRIHVAGIIRLQHQSFHMSSHILPGFKGNGGRDPDSLRLQRRVVNLTLYVASIFAIQFRWSHLLQAYPLPHCLNDVLCIHVGLACLIGANAAGQG